jgi:site-specific recombinase XerD
MNDNHADLEPIDPRTARELFINHKEGECADSTIRNYRYHLKPFLQWCDQEEIDNLNALSGRDIQQYRLWRKETSDLNRMTMKNHMSTMRVFLKWCASVEGVPSELYDKVLIPRVPPEERQRDETLDADDAEEILEYLQRYHYASSEHVILALLWETGMRMGGALALDLDDVLLDEKTLRLVHRPETDTPLKNGERGERLVAVSSDLVTIFEDYISDRRTDVMDEHGREPLLTTQNGRMRNTTLRKIVYKVTSPCFRNEPCHDCRGCREEKCGDAVSPHSIRRGSITNYLSNDVPVEVVSDRMNVGQKVLDQHYDERSEEVKVEQRRGYLKEV